MSESTALTVVERAKNALVITQTEEQLKALAVATKDIKAVTNADGREQVHSAMMVLKNTRCEIQRLGKAARDDATKFSKAVIAEENRLIALIEPEETRLEGIRDDWDAEIEAEKQRKIDAEIDRVEDLKKRVQELRGNQTLTSLCTPALLAEHIADLEKIPVDDSFEEFKQEAADAKLAGVAWLTRLHSASVMRVAEEARIAAERAELETLRKQQAERDRVERERIAAEEKAAKAARDAESAKQAEDLRKAREEHERIQREANEKLAAERKAQKEEADRVAAAQAIEAKRLADERAEFERQQRVAREQKEAEERLKSEQVRIANVKRPTDDDLIAVLAAHYHVPTKKVIDWLSTYRRQEAA